MTSCLFKHGVCRGGRTKIIATDVLANPLFEKLLGSLTEVQEVNVRSAQNLEAIGKSVSKCLRRIKIYR